MHVKNSNVTRCPHKLHVSSGFCALLFALYLVGGCAGGKNCTWKIQSQNNQATIKVESGICFVIFLWVQVSKPISKKWPVVDVVDYVVYSCEWVPLLYKKWKASGFF